MNDHYIYLIQPFIMCIRTTKNSWFLIPGIFVFIKHYQYECGIADRHLLFLIKVDLYLFLIKHFM